jgi:two-component system, NarL family, response regulator NreC
MQSATTRFTRVLIADDSSVVRHGIRQLLSSAPELQVCGEAIDGQDAIRKAVALTPDLILLDISMPGQSGLDAARAILQQLPVSIIIMSQHDPAHLVPRALAAGARTCIDKSRLAYDLLPAIASLQLPATKFRSATSRS